MIRYLKESYNRLKEVIKMFSKLFSYFFGIVFLFIFLVIIAVFIIPGYIFIGNPFINFVNFVGEKIIKVFELTN